MSRGKIVIGEPYIDKISNKYYLSSEINDNGIRKILSYGVDEEYGKYLADERSDAFVLALLYYAMIKDYDIEWMTPCTEQLIFQLKKFYIPIVSKAIGFLNNISLVGMLETDDIKGEGAVGTAISGGVDSTYSIHQYIDSEYSFNKLTHVVFTDCFTTSFSDDYVKDFMSAYMTSLPIQAKSLGVKLVYVEFHLDDKFSIGKFKDKQCGEITDLGMYTLKYCSLVFALKKLFGVYFFSSGQPAVDFEWFSKDTDAYDLFTMPQISTSNLTFYSSGMEVDRLEKVRDISDWDYAHQFLQVCAWKHDTNCGKCIKCVRTMSELYCLKKLEKFDKRFPIDDYKQNFAKRWAFLKVQAKTGHLDEIQLLQQAKQLHTTIPKMVYIYYPLLLLKERIRLFLKDRKFARKIYKKFNLDKILYGKSTSYYQS